jgi:hypothetical protein
MGFNNFSNTGAINAFRLVLRDKSVTPTGNSDFRIKRKNLQPISIAVDYGSTTASAVTELNITSDTDGKNLMLKSVSSGGDLHTFIRHSKFTLEHPDHDKHVTKITFNNAVAQSAVPMPMCMVSGTAMTTITCTIDATHAIRSRLVLRACAGTTCPMPAM